MNNILIPNTITISIDRYKKFLINEMYLQALKNMGVDKWPVNEWSVDDFIYEYIINNPNFINEIKEYPNEPITDIIEDIDLRMIADYEIKKIIGDN